MRSPKEMNEMTEQTDALPGEKASSRPKVVVVMPAYNAARTLRMTYMELPHERVDMVILVDDGSTDETVAVARELKAREIDVHWLPVINL